MEKDFDSWNKKKQLVNKREISIFFAEREIWFCYFGTNIGHEQDGKGDEFLRPAIIFRKFGREVFWAIPLTGVKKEGIYYFSFSFKADEINVAILSQIRLLDVHRLKRKLGVMAISDFTSLKQKFRALLP